MSRIGEEGAGLPVPKSLRSLSLGADIDEFK
jgi:hypothetical protein